MREEATGLIEVKEETMKEMRKGALISGRELWLCLALICVQKATSQEGLKLRAVQRQKSVALSWLRCP